VSERSRPRSRTYPGERRLAAGKGGRASDPSAVEKGLFEFREAAFDTIRVLDFDRVFFCGVFGFGRID
jgi:hypothetical protein